MMREPWQESESVMNQMYPYGAAMGCSPVVCFQGEEYPIGCEVAFGWNPFHSVGHFVSNAVKSAGREVGHVTHSIQSVGGKLTDAIKQVPYVGTPLHNIFDATYHAAMGPLHIVESVVIDGKRLDKAVLGHLKDSLKEFKQIGPYAQTILSTVPGVGSGISAAMAAGLAIAKGQSVDEVLKNGLLNAIPGGPMVQNAVNTGITTIKHVASGHAITDDLIHGVTANLPLPPEAKTALVSGIATMGAIVKGQPINKALVDHAVQGLPVPSHIKEAMTEASTVAHDLAHGKKLDHAVANRLNAIIAHLPDKHPLRNSIRTGIEVARKDSTKAEHILSTAIQSGLGDTLVSMGTHGLPSEVAKGLKSGVALGTASVAQAHRQLQLTKVIPGKLAESGVQLAKSSPFFGEARKIAASKNATKGFDIANGLLQQRVGIFDIATVRNTLDPTQKLGFDMATAARIGAVAHSKPKTLSAAAHAGHAITLGMQSYVPERKAAIMATVQAIPSAATGATAAIKHVAEHRENWFTRFFYNLFH